jgi:hypothetical protein
VMFFWIRQPTGSFTHTVAVVVLVVALAPVTLPNPTTLLPLNPAQIG